MNTVISDLERKDFEKQGYRVVGNHSVVKVCEWTKKALRGENVCYKCTFYGIRSWRCVEMSPTYLCDHKCVFCWRNTKYAWPTWTGPVDEPAIIIDGCIKQLPCLFQKMCEAGGYDIIDQKTESRVVLLMKKDSADRFLKFSTPSALNLTS